MIDGRNLFDQSVRNNIKTYVNIRKIAIDEEGDHATGCLLHYPFFKENYKVIAIDLSKQQNLDVDPKVIQQTGFTANLE